MISVCKCNKCRFRKATAEHTDKSEVKSTSWHSRKFNRTSQCEGTARWVRQRGKRSKGKARRRNDRPVLVKSRRRRSLSSSTSSSLFFNLLLCCVSPLSLLLTVWVFSACCLGYSWSLMYSVTFLWDQLTLGAVCVCYCMCRWGVCFFVFCMWEKQVERMTEFPPFLPSYSTLSGSQQPAGGFGAAPCLSGGQEDQGAECRHQVDTL